TTIPHIYRTTAPAGIVPRSFAPDSTRARSFTTVPAAAFTPFAISTSSPMSAPICGTECHVPSMFTSPGPEAAKKPARATTPDPITDSWTTLAGPRMTSSIRIEFATVVSAPIRTFFPRLVDGRRTAFGPISHPAPIDSGPWRYEPERITQQSPIVPRPVRAAADANVTVTATADGLHA